MTRSTQVEISSPRPRFAVLLFLSRGAVRIPPTRRRRRRRRKWSLLAVLEHFALPPWLPHHLTLRSVVRSGHLARERPNDQVTWSGPLVPGPVAGHRTSTPPPHALLGNNQRHFVRVCVVDVSATVLRTHDVVLVEFERRRAH